MERHAPLTYVDGFLLPAAMDNIDHNPSSATATGSFHGTSICLIQNPLRKAMIWSKLSCGNCRLKSASVLFLRAIRTSQLLCQRAASIYCKPSLGVQLIVHNQSTITDAISKEIEWLEDINKI